LEATPVKFGAGASEEAGWELKRLGVRRAMLVTDPGVAALGYPQTIGARIEAEGIEVVVYDRARFEPTIDSFQDAVDFALAHEVDGFVSCGPPRPSSSGGATCVEPSPTPMTSRPEGS
jgi:alcohol dehydrogenase class IV